MQKNKVFSLIDKAIYDYNLLEAKDKILIGASGGKDSTLLVEYFCNRRLRQDDFTFTALNIKTEIGGGLPLEIAGLFSKWKVDFQSIKVNLTERLKGENKLNCYWCSLQRRTELNNYAMKNGYNKIALGHHLDDVLTTLLMNMAEKGTLSTMIPLLKYDKYPVKIIRPLYYVTEEAIKKQSIKEGFSQYTCTCSFQSKSKRAFYREKLDALTEGDRRVKERILASLKNVKKEYLP